MIATSYVPQEPRPWPRPPATRKQAAIARENVVTKLERTEPPIEYADTRDLDPPPRIEAIPPGPMLGGPPPPSWSGPAHGFAPPESLPPPELAPPNAQAGLGMHAITGERVCQAITGYTVVGARIDDNDDIELHLQAKDLPDLWVAVLQPGYWNIVVSD